MMNEARFAVGMEGLALSERAYQHALAYAKERVQGPDAGVRGGPKVSILHHPDVRRMLMNMKCQHRGAARAGLRGRRRHRQGPPPPGRSRACARPGLLRI